MHLNKNVLIGLAMTAAAVFLVSPGAFRSVLPVLVLALCPLSMIFMMRGMGGHGHAHGPGCHGQAHGNGTGASKTGSEHGDGDVRPRPDDKEKTS